MDFKALQKEAHAIAKDHGWWDTERTFGDLIALVHSELSEALEAYRVNGIDSWLERQYPHSRDTQPLTHLDVPEEGDKPAGVASELADVVIRVADMAEWYGETIASRVGEPAFIGKSVSKPSFGDWVSELHWQVANAWNEHEYDRIGALSDVVHTTERMAAHYGIDLDAAIEAKMEYNRSRPYRHGGKAL